MTRNPFSPGNRFRSYFRRSAILLFSSFVFFLLLSVANHLVRRWPILLFPFDFVRRYAAAGTTATTSLLGRGIVRRAVGRRPPRASDIYTANNHHRRHVIRTVGAANGAVEEFDALERGTEENETGENKDEGVISFSLFSRLHSRLRRKGILARAE
jgi:hypothetical protein